MSLKYEPASELPHIYVKPHILPSSGALCASPRTSPAFKNNYFTEMCSGSEAGSYLRRVDSCITQLKAQGPSRTCHESKEEKPLATPSAGDSCDTECAPQNPPLKAGDLSREVDSQL